MTTPRDRRAFLRVGLTGLGTALSLPQLFQARANANDGKSRREPKAVILLWCRGGCSHLDTYDPKPDAPSEYRGPFAPLETKTPGMLLTELLPRQAALSDKFALLRSITHTGGGHPSGSLQVLTGDPDTRDKPAATRPDFMTVAHYARRSDRFRERAGLELPRYVGVNPVAKYDGIGIAGPGFLGHAWDPFAVWGDPSAPTFSVPNVGLRNGDDASRLSDRTSLRRSLEELRRAVDHADAGDAWDAFEHQAMGLLTSSKAAEAFDLSREPDRVRERYGRHKWGQQCLMARRLIEAGVEIVTTTFEGPQCGRVENWDDHAVNHHVFDALAFRAPPFDQAVSALIEDVFDRGLDRRTLIVVAGEFGRTPRITYVPSSGPGVASAAAGVVQPGRDHWPQANTMLFAGGGIRGGQIIGSTDAKGEGPKERAVGPQDFLATIYQHLGIDWRTFTVPDLQGRPTPIVTSGEAIRELTG